MKEMVLLCIILSVLLLGSKSPPGEFESPLGEKENKYLDEALKAINMTRHDFEYEKKWHGENDPFRLKVVENLMDYPLEVPAYVSNAKDEVLRAKENLKAVIFYQAKQLDIKLTPQDTIKLKNRINKGTKKIRLEDKVPEPIGNALSFLLSSFDFAKEHLDRAFSLLTREEIDSLLMKSIHIFSDEDDSTDDTLKGVLQREFEVAVDTTWEVEEKDILRMAKKVDRRELALSGLSVVIGVQEAINILSEWKAEGVNESDSIIFTYDTKFGKVVVGGKAENEYKDNYCIIIDLGGNDTYKCRVGGAIGFLSNSISVVIDLSGNDNYRFTKPVTQGAGLFGVGILYDLAGDDIYEASDNSQGAGLFGIGILVDMGGKDYYRSDFFAQGAASFGLGFLIDGEGNDTYRAYDYAQGFGSVHGYGIIHDVDGDDIYYAGGHYIHHPLLPNQYRSFAQGFAIGWRKDAAGGIGFLLDENGNDLYYSEVYGQGTSYWYSLGMLVDLKGNDTYQATEYAQGAGIHLSVGALLDFEGNDHYFSRFGPSQGEGHDLSVGFLMDKKGNDYYVTSGGQGIGLTNSVGIFIDSEGNDSYTSTEGDFGQGAANWRRGFGGIGIFLDLGGKDIYHGNSKGEEGSFWTNGTFGVGIDVMEE